LFTRFTILTSSDITLLKEMELATVSKPLRNRIQCILFSHKGIQVKDLSTYFDVSKKTVYQWLDRWDSHGAGGLVHKSGTGRKAKLRNIPAETIKAMVMEYPRNLKPVLAKLKEEYHVEVSKKTLQRFLKM
jgi:transposase